MSMVFLYCAGIRGVCCASA